MTTATIDPRSARALEILAQASAWQTGRTRDGRPFYAVPSQREPGLFHMTDGRECSCPDFRRRGVACKHMRAVTAFEALSAAPAPAASPEQPRQRRCAKCGDRVRPESIYTTCEDCTLLYGADVAPRPAMEFKPCRCGALIPPETPGSVCGQCVDRGLRRMLGEEV